MRNYKKLCGYDDPATRPHVVSVNLDSFKMVWWVSMAYACRLGLPISHSGKINPV